MVDGKGEAQSASAYLDGVLGDWGEGTVKDSFHRWVGTAAKQQHSSGTAATLFYLSAKRVV